MLNLPYYRVLHNQNNLHKMVRRLGHYFQNKNFCLESLWKPFVPRDQGVEVSF